MPRDAAEKLAANCGGKVLHEDRYFGDDGELDDENNR